MNKTIKTLGVLWLGLLALALMGCTATRPNGTKARLGDGYVTTSLGEMSVGDAAASAAKLAELAGGVSPEAKVAAMLLRGIGGGDKDESGVPTGWIVAWDHYLDGRQIDPTRIQSVPKLVPESGIVITVTGAPPTSAEASTPSPALPPAPPAADPIPPRPAVPGIDG